MGSASAEVITIDSDDEYSHQGKNKSGRIESCYIKFEIDDSGQIKREINEDDNACFGKIVINKPVNNLLDLNVGNKFSSTLKNSEVTESQGQESIHCNEDDEAYDIDTNSEESNKSNEAIIGKDNTLYECDDCNKKFTKKNSLLKHEKIHNLETFECDRCNKCFSQYSSLQIHRQTHPPLECLECYEMFSSEIDLKEHEETHKKVITPKKKSQRSNSSSSNKPASQLTKFKCNSCKWECKNFYRLRKHILKSHKFVIFYCNFCNQVLFSKDENEKHKDFDCPKKSFKCRNCLKRFPYDTALKRHSLVCKKKNSETQTEDMCICEHEDDEIETID